MERLGMQDGPPLSSNASKFQAYLRQQLVAEHRHLRLQRSRGRWRVTALAMTALFVLSVARPALPHGTRDRVSALLGRAPRPAGGAGAVSLDRALQASLEQDGVLARELGVRRADGVLRPDHAFVVSRFSMPGGRAVSIYTPLTARSKDQETDVSYVSEGGVW